MNLVVADTLTANYGKQVDSRDSNQGPPNLITYGGNNTAGERDVASALTAHPTGRYDFESETFVAAIALSNRGSAGDTFETLRSQSHGALPMVFGGNDTSGEREAAATLTAHPGGRYDFESENFVVAATLNSGGDSGGFRTEPGEHLVSVRTANTSANGHGLAEDIAHTLDGANGQAIATTGVRRLTPVECERLQGFPDNWTADQPDSTRYRQLGNAVAVPVARWIGSQIVKTQPAIPDHPPTSAPLRIPDGKGGQLWLKMGSLKDGCPIYEENEALSAGFVDLTQDQDAVWARAEAYHREKNGRAA